MLFRSAVPAGSTVDPDLPGVDVEDFSGESDSDADEGP